MTGGKKRSSQSRAGSRAQTAAGKAGRRKAAGKAEAPMLRPAPVYEFEAGGLAGHVRLADPGRGLVFCGAAEGKGLPAFSQEVLSLRHYLCRGGSGLLVPREESACEGKVEKNAAVFSYGKLRDWPLTATARYELRPQGGADVTFAFTFARSLRGFEAGVETLMPRSEAAVHIHSGGSWLRVAAGPQVQRFFPRNQGAAELIADGRWQALRLAGIGVAIEPRGYDYPMVVVRDERSGWALAYMALTEECSSVWVSTPSRAIGLGLVGADVSAQARVKCRLRVAFCQAERLDDALGHYREFVQEARAARE